MASNSLLGKLSQSTDKYTTIAISNQEDLTILMNDPLLEIADFFLMGDNILQVTAKRLSPFQKAETKQNVILGSYVTA